MCYSFRISILFVTLSAFGIFHPISAQINYSAANKPVAEPSMYFSHLTCKNGLPSERVYMLMQNFQGYVWLATDNGLTRYNGQSMKIFNHVIGDSTSIIDNIVNSIKEALDSTLWIGTLDGLSIYNPYDENFRNFSYYYKGNKHFPTKGIVCFFQDEDRSMWIGCVNGLIHTTERADKFEYFSTKGSELTTDRTYSFRHICKIIQDPRDKSKLLIATLGGLLQYDKLTNKITNDYKKLIHSAFGIIDMVLDTNQYLWTCGWEMGLNCIDLKTGKWQEFPYNKKKPIDIIRIQPKSVDEFWIATAGNGLGVFNKKTKNFTFYKKNNKVENTLLSNNINGIVFIGNEHDIWLPSDDGVNILKKELTSYKKIKLPIKECSVNTFFRDKNDKKLYVGTNGGKGLYVYDEQSGRWNCVFPDIYPNKQRINIQRIYKDSRSIIWISTTNNLYTLDKKQNRLIVFKTADNKTLNLNYPWITCMLEDNSHNIWMGTRIGTVVKIDSSLTCATYYIHNAENPYGLLDGTRTSSLYMDKYNRIWIGNDNGISIYDPVKKQFFNNLMDSLLNFGVTRRWVNGIKEDKLGNIWIAVDAAGLLRVSMISESKFQFKLISTANGLNSNIIGTIHTDKNKEFWFLNYGLLHFNPYDESSKLFDISNGLHQNINFDNSIYIDYDNNIYIGSQGMFETYSLNEFHYINNNIKLVLESIEINGQNIIRDYEKEKNQHLKLSANQNNINFHYSTICFQDVGQIKFRYKLDGYDRNWVHAGIAKEAKYTNLPAGDYIFNVQVMNRGVWLNKHLVIDLVIPQHFYKTWWFICIVVISIIVLIYIAFQYQIGQLMKVENMRKRIARDLHDDIGSTLSSISIMSELLLHKPLNTASAEKIALIGKNASLMLEKMDDIIWTVNPGNDSYANLELRIREFAIPLFESQNIDFTIKFDKNLSTIQLPMDKKHDIYLIVKEAVNNLVKYSSCNNCELKFYSVKQGFCVLISDNGIGFNVDIPSNRNGLRNMCQRAEQIGATIHINSVIGKGTEILLCLKTV